MGFVGKVLGDRKSKEFVELSNEMSSRKKVKRTHRRRNKKSVVQNLFEVCKEVFANAATGVVMPQDDIERLRAVLDGMTPEDLGLSPNMPHFTTTTDDRSPIISYLHLHECEKFSIGIFCLPPSAVIPLHNHPGMTVFSKLLFGTMHIKSYDWVTDTNFEPTANISSEQLDKQGMRLAKVTVDSDLKSPCNTSILYPAAGGNMHCFTARTACAVLDVLGPPYSDPDGRHCTYYTDFPFSKFSVDGLLLSEEDKESYAWLEERDKPDDLTVVGELYRGPKFLENY